MVLLQGIVAGALIPLQGHPWHQLVLVVVMAVGVVVVTGVVGYVVIYFARYNPSFLFDPRDIDASVHQLLYGAADKSVPPLEGLPVGFELGPP